MSKLKLVIFSTNLDSISGSTAEHSYQAVLDEFKAQADVYIYGPGHVAYSTNDTIENVLSKAPFDPDFLLFTHQWLIDTEGDPAVDPHPALKLQETKYPKICILNKEYVNLENKLHYLKNNRFDLVFTHHHQANLFSSKTGIPFVFLPLGYNHRAFSPSVQNETKNIKSIDLLFSGILQNSNVGVQSDVRLRAMEKLFFCIGDIPIKQKKSVKSMKIFWNGQPRSRLQRFVARQLGIGNVLPIHEYVDIQRQAKITLNALSPSGLVSSRHMESMAMRSLVFAEESNRYQDIFPEDLLVTYKADLSDFLDKLKFYLLNDDKRCEITNKAYKHVLVNHTWECRIKTIIGHLKTLGT